MSFHKKQFLSLFNDTARYHHRHKVFRDFIALASTSIHNSICFDETLEREYMEIVRQYEAKDAERMAMLLAEVVLGLEAEAGDFLGPLHMHLELGESARGQFFTPFCISRMMAEIQLGNIENILTEKPFVTVYEPACGSAGMLLAIAEVDPDPRSCSIKKQNSGMINTPLNGGGYQALDFEATIEDGSLLLSWENHESE